MDSNSKKVQCDLCGKSYDNTNGYLYEHKRKVHKINVYQRDPAKVGNLLCDICGAAFSSKKSLRNHRSLKHRGEGVKKSCAPREKNKPTANDEAISEETTSIINTFAIPDAARYEVVGTGTKQNGSTFVEIKFPVADVGEAMIFREAYEAKNVICLRTNNTQNKSKKASVIYKKKFHCWHYIVPSKSKHGERFTNCPFRLHIKVQRETSELFLYARIVDKHNHNTNCASSLKFRSVSDEVKEKFLSLFSYGFTPSRALRRHVNDLEDEVANAKELRRKMGDRFYCPDIKWVQTLHQNIFKKEYGSQYGLQMLRNLTQKVEQFDGAMMKMMDGENDNYVISIVTPFMRRVQKGFRESKEMIFMDSTGTLDLLNCKVFTLITNTGVGGLPVAIIITTTESEEAIVSGLEMICQLTNNGFKPAIFMTDNSAAERSALRRVFPSSTLLLCQFHVLQAVWRHLWKAENNIHSSDRSALFFRFKSLVHERSISEFESKLETFLEDEGLKKYPHLGKYLQDYWKIKEDWATSFRKDLITRGQTTNNICEASMRIIKEIILQRTKAYSPVHLLEIFTHEYEKYYVRKLMSISNGRIPDYLLHAQRKLKAKLDDLKYDAETQMVHNESKGTSYFIDTEMCVCSCPMGLEGKLCKHLFLVLKDSNHGNQIKMIPETLDSKEEIYYIATGEQLRDDPNWFASLQEDTSHILDERNTSSNNFGDGTNNNKDSDRIGSEFGDVVTTNTEEEETITDMDVMNELTPTEHDRAIEACDLFCKGLMEKVKTNPCLSTAMISCHKSFDSIKTTTGLEKALATFSKYAVAVSGRKKIPVSSTAIARRARKNTLGTGPLLKSQRRSDHSFARAGNSVLMPKRVKKTPRLLSDRIRMKAK